MCKTYSRLFLVISAIVAFFVQPFVVTAQISEGGIPPSFRYETTLRNAQAVYEAPVSFYVEDLKQVDEWQINEGIAPPRVAVSIDVSLDTENAGRWSQLPSGETIWQLNIRAKDALALMLYYSDFYIPEGGKLYIYNAEKTQLLGAYTHRTHPSGGRFATEFVGGDDLTLEYVAAPDGQQPRIAIEAIGYGYNYLTVTKNGVSLRRASAYCEVNVNCEEGDAWQNQKKGVCRITQRIGGGTYYCSGSLVNNTGQDLTPYILSATHCMVGNVGQEATPEEMDQWVFHFNMEHNECSNDSEATEPKSIVGCKKVAATQTNGESDGLLLLLNMAVPESYNVYYNGWHRKDLPAQTGVSIHHPWGDQKKISTFKEAITHATFSSTADGISGDRNAHWNVIFAATSNGHGITESGSSGAPLFNEDKLIVGTLTGGNSTCSNPTGLNLYGKLAYHWNKYQVDDNTRMDKWLDPVGSGVEILEGRYHNMDGIHPPADLKAVYQSDKTVRLTWEKPVAGTPARYNIYNNDLKIGETTALSYIDEQPNIGTQTYSVSSVYAGGNESNFVHATVPVNEFKAPVNVAVGYTMQQKIAVVWDPPVYEQTIYWGESRAVNKVTMDGTSPFYFGQQWNKGEIECYHKKKIKAVKFVPIKNNTYEIYIAQGDDRTYIQKVSNLTYSETNTIELETPYVIDGTKNLIVALYVSVHSQSGRDSEYPAVCDGGPAVDGKGNIYSYDGKTWKTLNGEADEPDDFDFNFFVAAVVSSEEGDITKLTNATPGPEMRRAPGKPALRSATLSFSADPIDLYSLRPAAFPEATGYTIYRDNEKIATVNTSPRRYLDDAPSKTTYYQVAAMFDTYEGERSDSVSINPMNTDLIESEGAMLYPAVFSNQVEVRGLYQATRADVYDTSGKLCMRINEPDNVINTHSLRPGIYYFRIYLKNGDAVVLRGVKR